MKIRSLSIKRKLMLATALLLLTVGGFISIFFPYRQKVNMKKYLADKATVVAGIIAGNSEAGLTFGDASAVNETLKGLKNVNDIEFAVVLDEKGAVFAEYHTDKAKPILANIEDLTRNISETTWESQGLLLKTVQIGDTQSLGKVILGVGLETLESDVAASRYVAIGIGLLIIVVGNLVFSVFASRLVQPIKDLQVAAERIARGDAGVLVEFKSEDEIGRLADSFRELINYFKGVAAAAEAINKGDLTAEVMTKSDQDVLSRNLLALKCVMNEISLLLDAVREGKLSVRGNPDNFQGIYRTLISAINEMMNEIVHPIRDASSVLERVAKRDLTARMQGTYRGDYALMKEALDTAVSNLEEGLQQVAVTSEQVAQASEEINSNSQNLSRGGIEQAAALKEVSDQLNGMMNLINHNSSIAREVSAISRSALQSSQKGVNSMRRLSEAIDRIKGSADATVKIVKTIDEIAFQTNLLALNAAVEAARAGESGKGFAVVAEEVRNLAMRSAQAAKNTAELLEESSLNANSGVEINREVLSDLEEINGQVNKVTQVVQEITTASDEQIAGAQHITTALSRASSVTQQNAASAEESAASATELSAQADTMRRLAFTFTFGGQNTTSKIPEPWTAQKDRERYPLDSYV